MIQRIVEALKKMAQGAAAGPNRMRIVLVAVMILLVVVSLGRFLVSGYYEYSTKIANQTEMQLTRYNSLSRLMAEADRYREEHSTLVRFRNEFLDSGLIQASTPALAEAQLQNLINALASEANLSVRSMRMLPRTQQGNITNLRIGINCRGEIGAIKDFLHTASVNDKFLFVDQIQIQILNQRERRHFNFNAEIVAWIRS
ncbi:MAG: type II secretion system protein GspM [Desulfonatronovibrio sp.]